MALLSRARSVEFPAPSAISVSEWSHELVRTVQAEIGAEPYADLSPAKIQSATTARLKPVLERAKAAIRTRFEETGDGLSCARAYASVMDEILAGLHRLATETAYPVANPTLGESLQLMALGGYGRGALAPYSDIDLMILLPYKRTARAEQVVEFILYVLWDLGLKVGHAVRSVDECVRLAKTDMVIRTSVARHASAGRATKPLRDDLVKRLGARRAGGVGNRAYHRRQAGGARAAAGENRR